MSNLDSTRTQAQIDHDQNRNWPTNTHNWEANQRNVYEAERTRLQQQQEEAKKR